MKSNESVIAKELMELRTKLIEGEASDGHHTHNELYLYRMLYNAGLFNEWAANGKYNVHKSWRHSDGELCFGEDHVWFVVYAELPTGQISNHYKAKYWTLFNIPVVIIPKIEYDGHTPEVAASRLYKLLEDTALYPIPRSYY